MDAVIFMSIAVFFVIRQLRNSDSVANEEMEVSYAKERSDTERTAKLNESFYKDENAFSEIINALGFPKE